MMLSDKCKIDFEEWYNPLSVLDEDGVYITDLRLELLTDSMQFGVIQDFADSVGINLEVRKSPIAIKFWVSIEDDDIDWCDTRPEARAEAVKQFNKLYNETNRKV